MSSQRLNRLSETKVPSPRALCFCCLPIKQPPYLSTGNSDLFLQCLSNPQGSCSYRLCILYILTMIISSWQSVSLSSIPLMNSPKPSPFIVQCMASHKGLSQEQMEGVFTEVALGWTVSVSCSARLNSRPLGAVVWGAWGAGEGVSVKKPQSLRSSLLSP